MTALDVLFKLDQLGCQVLLEGENIRVIPPEGVKLTDELRQAIRSNKEELVSLLRHLETAIIKRQLQEEGWVSIFSETLGEPVVWLMDATVQVPEEWQGVAKYTISELAKLAGLSPGDLCLIHTAKKFFKAKLVS